MPEPLAVQFRDRLEVRSVRLGVIPLTDCAPIAVARERGWFRKYGLDVEISQEPSWSSVRDKVALGVLDGGHMLGVMTIAATLGLGGPGRPMIAPVSLGLNGCAITVSTGLWQRMVEADPQAGSGPLAAAHALRRVINQRRAIGAPPLTFGAVFPYSAHNYLLRYWLAAGGIDPDGDVQIMVVPPPLMVAKLSARHIDGYCVGEPWGQRAVDLGIGRCVAPSREIWTSHPDKVLGVAAEWAARHPNTLRALVAAITEASMWLDDPVNRGEAARLVAGRAYVNAPEEIVAASLTGRVRVAAEDEPVSIPDFHVFHRGAANFPWVSHAEWALTQMRRWGQLGASVNVRATAAAVYRPDIFRDVAAALSIACPTISRKSEGAHGASWILNEATAPISMGADCFVDGRIFDPSRLDDYITDLQPIPEESAGRDRSA